MFTKHPNFVPNYNKKNSTTLILGSGYAIVLFAMLMMYGLLPIIITEQYSAQTSGIIITIANIITFLVAPIAGSLADRSSGLTVTKGMCIFLFLGSITRLIGRDGIRTISIMSLFYFMALGCNVIEGYTLKNTSKKDGGKIFGFIMSILSVGYLASTLVFPYLKNTYFPSVPIIIILAALILLSLTIVIEDTNKKKLKRSDLKKSFDIGSDIKQGLHFVKTNNYYPIFALANTLFRGIFFAGLWFLIPLTLSQNPSWIEGLQLGIYEIITIMFAGIAGFLADRYNRKKINSIGWILLIIGAMGIIYSMNTSIILIMAVLIGLGNNLTYGAGNHILEETDNDHEEDGSYSGLQRLTYNFGYVITPVLLGGIYSQQGLQISMGTLMTIVILIAVVTIRLTQHTEILESKEVFPQC